MSFLWFPLQKVPQAESFSELCTDGAAQMGTLSSDRCSNAEAERAALTATVSTAAPFALNRDAARRQAVTQAASSAGGIAAAAAQQSDGSQVEAMAAAGDEMQPVLPDQPVQSQQPHRGPQQRAEQGAAESQPGGEPAGQVPLEVADSQEVVPVSAFGQLSAGATQTDTAPAATETVPALTSAASAAFAEPVDTNGAKWDSEAAMEAAQPAVTQSATTPLMLGSREARQQNLATASSGAGGAAVGGQSRRTEAEAR